MMEHTISELLWLLLIYSLLGWISEAAVGTFKNKAFTNRGFSTGPFCLVYGIAAVVMEVTLTDLSSQPLFLFLACGIQATVIEWFTGKILERLNHHKWWDYSDKKWNFDGYICPQYSLLWAVLGMISLRLATPFFLRLYHKLPDPVASIIVWTFLIYLVLDIAVSLAAVLHARKFSEKDTEAELPAPDFQKFKDWSFRAGIPVIGFVERRLARVYPVIQEKPQVIFREGRFAEGCGFYKLFWLFLIGSLLGDITETLFCRVTAGEWMYRSSLVWGPFSIVWGFAIVLATILLYKDREKPDRHIFLIGTILGGAYEYMCSVLSELVFGQVFWDYSRIPFNLGGRINLLYCFFWGIAAVIWIKGLYPVFSRWIEKIPKITGYILTWLLVLFMSVNMLVSAAALIRYSARDGGPPAKSGWEHVIDTHFDDQRMQQQYPNAQKTERISF